MKNREKTPLIACNLCCILERKEDADLLVQKLQRNGLGAGCIAPKYAKEFDVKITNIPLRSIGIWMRRWKKCFRSFALKWIYCRK